MKSTLDIDVSMPFCYRANIAEPIYPLDENSWPKADKDCLPGQPGQSNDMGITLPEIPESVPGEPQIGQDKIIDQGDDHIILEYEIEFPKPLKIDEKPTLPGSGSSGTLPELPAVALIDPTQY